MSKVYITAIIRIDTKIMDKDIVKLVEEKIKDGPEITGDAGNAKLEIKAVPGFNYKGAINCSGCPYESSLIAGSEEGGGGVICESPTGYVCPTCDFQTEVNVVITGELENRIKEETLKEYKYFIAYLKRKRKGCNFEIKQNNYRILEF